MSGRLGVLTTAALLGIACAALVAEAAEKRNISGTYKLGEIVSTTTVAPGDVEGHTLVMFIYPHQRCDG
jgi:hypothetical protein